MRGAPERARGVMLKKMVIPQDHFDEALRRWKAHREIDGHEVEENTVVVSNLSHAVSDRDGVLYVVCTEGVGWVVTDDEPLEVELYTETRVAHPVDARATVKSFGIFPVMTLSLSPAEVRSMVTDEEVDLADHVRSFGARLESNFWTWHRLLTRNAEERENADA